MLIVVCLLNALSRDSPRCSRHACSRPAVTQVALRTLFFESGEKLATLAQEALTLRPTADVYVVVSARATATIAMPDLIANDAIIHVVDTVLVPDSVRVTVS